MSTHSAEVKRAAEWICKCLCGTLADKDNPYKSYEYKREIGPSLIKKPTRVSVQSVLFCKDRKITGDLHVKLEVKE